MPIQYQSRPEVACARTTHAITFYIYQKPRNNEQEDETNPFGCVEMKSDRHRKIMSVDIERCSHNRFQS